MELELREDGPKHLTEQQIVKQALRSYVVDCEEQAAHHDSRGYSGAALSYMQRAFVIRGVLEREFDDTNIPAGPYAITL